MSNHKKYFIFVQQNSRLTTLLNKGANEETIVGNEAAMQSSWTTENRCYFWRLHETSIGVQGVQTRLKRNVRFESK